MGVRPRFGVSSALPIHSLQGSPRMNTSRDLSLDLIETGFAIAAVDDPAARCLAELIEQARTYFRRPLEQKTLNSSKDANFGYRPYGQEYSQDPTRPDSMESFTVWSDRIDL